MIIETVNYLDDMSLDVGVIKDAQKHFHGVVEAVALSGDRQSNILIIKKFKPTFADAPYMTIRADAPDDDNFAYHGGHYDLTRAKAYASFIERIS